MEISLGFTDVAIKQKKNQCRSRLDVNLESEIIRGITRPIPIIAANMSTVVDSYFCTKLYKMGAFGILHRAATESSLIAQTQDIASQCMNVAVSIGVGEDQKEMARKLVDAGATIITVDIAHGYCDAVIEMGRFLKQEYGVRVILGNTTNIDMMYEVEDFADALKVGIASGAGCETKNTAGCFERQFSAVLKFKEVSKKLGIPIISAGGIREPSAFVKAIGAGANSVMAGSIFARCPESAAEEIDGYKIYAGMASRYVQDKWKGGLKKGTCPEGKVIKLHIGESLEKLLERYSGALRTGITYAGGTNIKSFQENVEFIRLAK